MFCCRADPDCLGFDESLAWSSIDDDSRRLAETGIATHSNEENNATAHAKENRKVTAESMRARRHFQAHKAEIAKRVKNLEHARDHAIAAKDPELFHIHMPLVDTGVAPAVRRGLLESSGEASGEVSASGEIGASGGLTIVMNPEDGTATFSLTVEVTADAVIGLDGAADKTYSKEVELGPEIMIFKKMFMVGKFPALVTFSVTPMLWFEATASATCSGSVAVSYTGTASATVRLNTEDKSLDYDFEFDPGQIVIAPVVGSCTFDAAVSARVGPTFTVDVNESPVSLDIAPALHADLSISADATLSDFTPVSIQAQNTDVFAGLTWSACFTGSASVRASLDVRPSVDFTLPNPADAAYTACVISVDLVLENDAAAFATCAADALGLDASEAVDSLKQDMLNECTNLKELLDSTKTEWCAITKGTSTFTAGDWSEYPIASASVDIQGFCLGSEQTEGEVLGSTAIDVDCAMASVSGGAAVKPSLGLALLTICLGVTWMANFF